MKTDASGTTLSGAEFTLYTDSNCTTPAVFYSNSALTTQVTDGKAVTGSDGKLHMYGLSNGTYYLKETSAPSGYILPEELITIFTVRSGTITVLSSPYGEYSVSGSKLYLTVANYKSDEMFVSVDVTKIWNDDGADHSGDEVEVQLYADGVAYGDAVKLNSTNGWTYTWNELSLLNDDGNTIAYTVGETAFPGYETQISDAVVSTGSGTIWARVASLVAGDTYILTNGADQAMYIDADNTAYDSFAAGNNYPVRIHGDMMFSVYGSSDLPANVQWLCEANGSNFKLTNIWATDNNTHDGIIQKYFCRDVTGDAETLRVRTGGTTLRYTNNQLQTYYNGDTDKWRYRVVWNNSSNIFMATDGTGNQYNDIVLFHPQTCTKKTVSYTITNTKEVSQTFTLLKKGGTVDGPALAGTEFSLYGADENWTQQEEPCLSGITIEDGTVQFENVLVGKYLLYETQAADGYYLPKDPWRVEVTADGVTLWDSEGNELTQENGLNYFLILNQVGYELPETGGAGTTKYTIGGLALMAVCLLYGCVMRRKRERRIE